jgi:hypothetical protein
MEWTILELDPVRFAVGEKCYDVLVNELKMLDGKSQA